MKQYTRLISTLTAFVLLLTLGAAAADLNGSSLDDGMELMVDGYGRLVAETAEVQALQATLDDYFSVRAMSVGADATISPMSAGAVDTQCTNDSVQRAAALIDFWAGEGIDIVSVDSSAYVLEGTRTFSSNNVDLKVYEWTWVDYNNGLGADAPATDQMGFATIHDMSAELTEAGTFQIVRDAYDEADISGHVSADYIEVMASPDPSALMEMETASMPAALQASIVTSNLNKDGLSRIYGLLDYADTYVWKNIANYDERGLCHTANYNTAVYGYSSSTDCANYVSQCLYAGGFVMDASPKTWDNLGVWYHDRDGTASGSKTWMGSISLHDYLTAKGYTTVTASTSNVYPGNPVWTCDKKDYDHVAICVGYNSAGKPIINGHTRDVYHQVLSTGYKKTALISTSNTTWNSPASAATISAYPAYVNAELTHTQESDWYKIVIYSASHVKIQTTRNLNTMCLLYQEKSTASDHYPEDPTYGTMHMYELYRSGVNPSGNTIMEIESLPAGTYYLRVRGHGAALSTGPYGLSVELL